MEVFAVNHGEFAFNVLYLVALLGGCLLLGGLLGREGGFLHDGGALASGGSECTGNARCHVTSLEDGAGARSVREVDD